MDCSSLLSESEGVVGVSLNAEREGLEALK